MHGYILLKTFYAYAANFDVVLVDEFFFSKGIWLKSLCINLRKVLLMLVLTLLLKNVRELASDLKAVVNHVESPVELYEDSVIS